MLVCALLLGCEGGGEPGKPHSSSTTGAEDASAGPLEPKLSTVLLAASEKGFPRVALEGPGRLQYKHSLHQFEFDVYDGDQSVASGSGKFVWGNSNDVTITVQFSVSREIDLKLLGFSGAPEGGKQTQWSEVIHVAPGAKPLELQRYCQQWYEFD